MSSKLLSPGSDANVRPMEWKRSQVGSVCPADRSGAGSYAPESSAARPGTEQRLAAIERELERKVQDACQQGLREGQEGAARKWSEELGRKIEQLARGAEGLAAYRDRIRREAEVDLVKLSLTISRRLMRRELTVDPDALLGIVRAGLDKLAARDVHRLRVHPEHRDTVERFLQQSAWRIEVQADAAIGWGGAIFETRGGEVDIGLESQLAEIERGFTDLLPQ
ncbi:MAG: FliH/SctL family protein [Bryobacteraceae bacterium]